MSIVDPHNLDLLTSWLALRFETEPRNIRLSLRAPLAHQSKRWYDLWVQDDHLILKEYLKQAEFLSGPKFEFEALQLLEPLAIAPEPIFWSKQAPGEPGPIVVYRFLKGQMWDRQKPTGTQLERLANLYLRVHDQSRPELWTSRGLTQIEQLKEIFLPRYEKNIQAYERWALAHFPVAVETMAPNERLRRNLARAIAWPNDSFEAELADFSGLSFFPEPALNA